MIIWTGLGFWVAVITFGACLLFNYVLDARFDEGYYSTHSWAVGSALFVGGLISSTVGFALKFRDDREVIDAQTGERFMINRSDHSFFFVPMHWSGIAIAVIGFVVVIYDMVR